MAIKAKKIAPLSGSKRKNEYSKNGVATRGTKSIVNTGKSMLKEYARKKK